MLKNDASIRPRAQTAFHQVSGPFSLRSSFHVLPLAPLGTRREAPVCEPEAGGLPCQVPGRRHQGTHVRLNDRPGEALGLDGAIHSMQPLDRLRETPHQNHHALISEKVSWSKVGEIQHAPSSGLGCR